MYLSKVMITGSACRNPYELHRVLWTLFPENPSAARDFLFRVEQSEQNRAEILMQSLRKPVGNAKDVRILACRDYPLLLKAGQRLRFLLIANPVRMINDEAGRKNAVGDTKKCRVPLVREEEQRQWIERKLSEVALLEAISIDPVSHLRFRKLREGRVGKIQPVSFQGVLQVKEPETMLAVARDGVGPAKAFGCGMLSLARA